MVGALQIELPDVGVTGKRYLFHVAMGMPRRNATKTPKDRPQGPETIISAKGDTVM